MNQSRGLVRVVAAAMVLALVGSTAAAVTRTWTDRTGRHQVEAEFVKLEDGQVTLRRTDGEEVVLPLDRFSEKDRQVAERLAAADADETPSPDDIRADRQAVEETAVKFFETLQGTDRAGLRELLTQAARTRLDAGQSPVQELPSPDRGRIRASRVNVDGETATTDVSVRLRGQYQRTTLHLRRESGNWLIHSIAAPGPGGDTVTVDFEGDGGAGAPDGAAVTSRTIVVPEGNPKELLEFIEQSMKTDFSGAATPEEMQEQAKGVFAAVLTASDKVLSSDATLPQKKTAAGHKLQAIRVLSTLGVPGMADRLTGFTDELDQLGLGELKPMVQTFLLAAQLQNYRSLGRPEAKKVVEQAVAHLQAVEIGTGEAQLAQAAGDVAEMIDTKFAAEVHAALGNLLATSTERSIKGLGESMLGTARRLGLVGNPLELSGVMLDGTPFNLSQYEGKVVLVDFWATWCGPCIAEMPNIRRNFEQYHSQGFEVVAVSVDRDLGALREYVQRDSPPWTILADYHPQVPADQRMSRYYGVSAIPTTILVGADGKVISLSCRGEQLGAHLQRLFGPAS